MKLAIRSSSAVIARNLTTIAQQMGWVVEADAETTLIHSEDGLHLRRGEAITPLPCPIHPRALLAALQSPIAPTASAAHLLAHGWAFDPVLRSVFFDDTAVGLTEKESLLLSALLAALPHAAGREALLKEVWSYETDIETHTLETHIYRLRQKLETPEPPPCRIETIDGAYRLVL